MTLSYLRDRPAEAHAFADQHCDYLGIPQKCMCGNNGGGDCEWCMAYEDYLINGEAFDTIAQEMKDAQT